MPRLVRLYILQGLLGFVIAAAFVAGLLWFDVGRLRYLATHTEQGPFAVLLLWAHMGFIFGGVQFAIAVMRMGGARDDAGPGGPRLRRRPLRVAARTRVPRAGRRSLRLVSGRRAAGTTTTVWVRIPEDLFIQVGAR